MRNKSSFILILILITFISYCYLDENIIFKKCPNTLHHINECSRTIESWKKQYYNGMTEDVFSNAVKDKINDEINRLNLYYHSCDKEYIEILDKKGFIRNIEYVLEQIDNRHYKK